MITMKAWQYTTASGGLEKNLFMPADGIPKPKITADQVLIEVHSASINPADHKVPEVGILTRAARPGTVVPGMDFCGQVVEVGPKVAGVSIGQMVFGCKMGPPNRGGSLAEYMAVSKNMFAPLPDGVKADDAASMGVVGLSAYLSIKPNVKEGDKIFVNGGSGGTGVLSIQVAKALGCHVTTSCSGANIELCKSLGADEVIDYKETDVVEALKKKGQIFTLLVDNVASSSNLYSQSHHFLVPSGKFEQVGAEVSMATLSTVVKGKLLPGFLGGGKRKHNLFLAHNDSEAIMQIGKWMEEGKVKAVIDSVFEFEDVPKAFEKLKTHRAKGKIVIHVKKE